MSSTRAMTKMKVSSIIDHTPSVRELVLEIVEPQNFVYKAGQFVTLHVPQEPKPAMRAYSIASDDRNSKSFRLLFKFVDSGVASTYVWKLKGGEILNFTGPFGRVLFKEPPTQQIIFLNTGTGLSQHYCYLMSKKDLFPQLQYRMLFGVRNESEMYYEPQLNELKKELPNFNWEFVLSRPSEKWQGKRGYIQHFLKEFDYKNIETTFYLCGNGGMIKEVKHQLIAVDGIDKTKIHSEAFD
jgi:CDP-4-dehydro-6-deoxyglucose reductase, E3